MVKRKNPEPVQDITDIHEFIDSEVLTLLERTIKAQIWFAAIVGATVIIAAIVGFLGVHWLA